MMDMAIGRSGDTDAASRDAGREQKQSRKNVASQRVSCKDMQHQLQASTQMLIDHLTDVLELSVHEQQTLLTIANRLISGSTAFPTKQVGRAIAQMSDKEHLTAREHEVLTWLASEECPENIAEILGISVNTLRTHTTNIYAKLRVSGRGEAVLVARSCGILTHSD